MNLRKFKREEDILTIISWLWMMPLLSLPELETVSGLTYNRCHRLMKDLARQGKVTSVRLGMTLELRDRWFLTTSGVDFAMEGLGYSLEWSVSEAGLKRHIRRLPILETFYRLVSRLWSLHGIEGINPIYRSRDPDVEPLTFPAGLPLRRFQWQRDPDIHAISEYANEAWAPWVWVGPMTKGIMMEDKRKRGLAKFREPSRTGQIPSPAAWVVVGADLLSANQASGPWEEDNALVITANGVTLKSMRPEDFTEPRFEDARTADLGMLESIPAWVETDPAVSALNGKLNFGLFQFNAQWPGARVGQLHKRSTHSHGEINAALEKMGKAGLTVKLDRALYLTRAGMLAAAQMDRISHQSIYGSFDVYLKPDGNYRRDRLRHDRAVADFVLAWTRDGGEAFHGRRNVFNLPDRTQLAPDAVASQFRADGSVGWWFVEVELSARATSAVRRRLRPYRMFQQHQGWCPLLLVVVDTQEAENVFLLEGRGLPMATTTLDRLLTSARGVSPWREP